MAPLHSTAQLERRIAAQTPACSALRDLDRAEDHLRSQLPALAARPAVVPAVDKLRTLLAASFCFDPETSSPACSRIGASPLSYWSRDVNGACDGSSFSGSPGPGQFGFRSTVFDVAAWLELVNKDEANVGSATMNPRISWHIACFADGARSLSFAGSTQWG